MSTTCAHCGAEVGDASTCPRCGRAVLPAAQWATDTAERPAVRAPVEPAHPSSLPGPPRYPMYADQETSSYADTAVHAPVPPPPYLPPQQTDDDRGSRVGAWVVWVVAALVAMVLVAAGGVWLLLSPSGSPSQAPSQPSVSKIGANQAPTPSHRPSSTPQQTESTDSPTPKAGGSDGTDLASTASAAAPRSAPPNEDVFGNRTTYDAANMVDGRPDTCWRMAGDGTGAVLVFHLPTPATLTRVGLINGYAKKALEGGHQLDWYAGNRRVLSAQWIFDDGTRVDQRFSPTKTMQTIDLDHPVKTSTIQLLLTTVSPPGAGRSARDYTAISEVSLVGTPA